MVDGLDPDADDVRHPGDYIEEEMVPYIDRAILGRMCTSHNIIDTTWGPIFTACYPVSANHDGTGEIIGAFCMKWICNRLMEWLKRRIIVPSSAV